MNKAQTFVVWLDGFLNASGPTLDKSKTLIIRNKLNDLFEHEADKIKEDESHSYLTLNNEDTSNVVLRC